MRTRWRRGEVALRPAPSPTLRQGGRVLPGAHYKYATRLMPGNGRGRDPHESYRASAVFFAGCGNSTRLCRQEQGAMLGCMDKDSAPTIRELYPHLSDEQLREAEDNMEQYLALALRVYERIAADPAAYAQFRTLTASTGTVRCTRPKGACPPS